MGWRLHRSTSRENNSPSYAYIFVSDKVGSHPLIPLGRFVLWLL